MKSLIDKTGAAYNLMGVGLGAGTCIALCLWLGYSADKHFSCYPYGIISGIVLGLASAMNYMMEQINKNVKKLENDKNKEEK